MLAKVAPTMQHFLLAILTNLPIGSYDYDGLYRSNLCIWWI